MKHHRAHRVSSYVTCSKITTGPVGHKIVSGWPASSEYSVPHSTADTMFSVTACNIARTILHIHQVCPTDQLLLGNVTEQRAERDDGSEKREVDADAGAQALQVESVGEVGLIVRQLALDVGEQTAETSVCVRSNCGVCCRSGARLTAR